MDVHEAIAAARKHVEDVYAGEGVTNISLEETEWDEAKGRWVITLGFNRASHAPRTRAQEMLENLGSLNTPFRRSYKALTVLHDGTIASMKNIAAQEAAA